MKKIILITGILSILLSSCGSTVDTEESIKENPDSIRTNNSNQTITIPTDL